MTFSILEVVAFAYGAGILAYLHAVYVLVDNSRPQAAWVFLLWPAFPLFHAFDWALDMVERRARRKRIRERERSR